MAPSIGSFEIKIAASNAIGLRKNVSWRDHRPLRVNSDGLVPLVTVPLIPPIADMQADMRWLRLRARSGDKPRLFNYLIGAGEYRWRNADTKRLGGMKVDE